MLSLRFWKATIMIAILSTAPSQPQAASLSAVGSYPVKDRGLVVARLPQSSAGVPYYVYVPAKPRADAMPLVSVHGISRNAPDHAAAFGPLAEATGRVIIAPLFSMRGCRRYQRVLDTCRADNALLTTLDSVAADIGVAVDRFDLFGFSGGAQFAHRFAMLHPARVRRLALASAGWYTLPTTDYSFPVGAAPDSAEGVRLQTTLAAFLAVPTLVMVGEHDITRDANLRRTHRLDRRQGLTRVERGARFVQTFRRAAKDAGITPVARFRTIPGCAHSFEDCIDKGGMTDLLLDWFAESS